MNRTIIMNTKVILSVCYVITGKPLHPEGHWLLFTALTNTHAGGVGDQS